MKSKKICYHSNKGESENPMFTAYFFFFFLNEAVYLGKQWLISSGQNNKMLFLKLCQWELSSSIWDEPLLKWLSYLMK